MDNWGKLDETTVPLKEAFYSKLNLEDTSDVDYQRAQKVWEIFGIKNGFENFRNMCLEIYELDPV